MSNNKIFIGLKNDFETKITKEKVFKFIKLSGDNSLLHRDTNFAKKKGFSGPVVHGAYIVSLVSQAVGRWLIGNNCLIGNYQANFINPVIYPIKLKIKSEVILWSQNSLVGKIKTLVVDADQKVYSEVFTDFRFLKKYLNLKKTTKIIIRDKQYLNKKTIIIIGSSSGLFQSIKNKFKKKYNIILVNRNKKLPFKGCRIIVNDLDSKINKLSSQIKKSLHEKEKIWGILNFAHPFPSQLKLLALEDLYFKKISRINLLLPVIFSRILKENLSISKGGRLINIASNYSFFGKVNTKFISYSLSKSILILITKFLANELAAYKITSNSISPDMINVGFNKNMHSKILDFYKSQNPSNKLCSPNDVSNVLFFLLSEKSEFISGENIGIHGGLL